MIEIHTDGGSRNNPGDAGIGAFIKKDGEVLAEISEYIGIATNNVAEYTAVVRALEWCIEHGHTSEHIAFKMDSMLVVQQVQGVWKVKEPTLRPFVDKVREFARAFPGVTFTHVRREFNKDADRLVNEAIDRGQAGEVIH